MSMRKNSISATDSIVSEFHTPRTLKTHDQLQSRTENGENWRSHIHISERNKEKNPFTFELNFQQRILINFRLIRFPFAYFFR